MSEHGNGAYELKWMHSTARESTPKTQTFRASNDESAKETAAATLKKLGVVSGRLTELVDAKGNPQNRSIGHVSATR
jgi:hypothetical protein